MSNVVPFTFDNIAIRTIEIDGEPWFVARDVAIALGYVDATNAIKQHCKGVVKRHPLETAGGTQHPRIIAEADVLRLIVGSRLPAAEAFERWVFEVVLPTIRRSGTYAPVAAPALDLRDPRQMVAVALQLVHINEELQQKLTAAAPKVEYYDRFADADGLLGLENAGRALHQRPKKFTAWLRTAGICFYQGRTIVAKVQYIARGYFETRQITQRTRDGDIVRLQTFVTPKGLQWLARELNVQPMQASA